MSRQLARLALAALALALLAALALGAWQAAAEAALDTTRRITR